MEKNNEDSKQAESTSNKKIPSKKEKKAGFFGFLRRTPKNKKKDSKQKVVQKEEKKISPLRKVIESYWIHNPLAKVEIGYKKKNLIYMVQEAKLSPREKKAYERIVSIITKELASPETLDVDLHTYILSEARRVANKYKRSIGEFNKESWQKIYYYIIRDLAGFGILDVLVKDPSIEDISCNGIDKPVYIWHRKYESVPTNIQFQDEDSFDDFIVKLAHMSDKHISSAHPILDAMLPGKHRLAATFRKEVSTFGSSLCIRKFKREPFSIIDLIKIGTLDEKLAAYFWTLLENKMSIMVIGGTGAGKTSMINALLSMIKPNDKIVTVEDISEMNTLHNNWVQLTSRRAFKFGATDDTSISLFDLVKLSLRYRPDYIIVGEIRGEEAYALFQAVATGHGGITTMHADSIDHAVKRLTSEPMNVAEVYVPLMNACIYVSRTELPKKKMGLHFGRRIRNVWEIQGHGNYHLLSEWSPRKDIFHTNLEDSFLLDQIATMKGLSKDKVLAEVERKEQTLNEVFKAKKISQREVTDTIVNYYGGIKKGRIRR